jgi:flagellar basal-body rod modification protein FlgD
MATESIGAVSSSTTNVAQRAGLQQEDFLKVLLAQLTFQDPLKPLDNNEFIAQFAQLTNLQQTQQLNDKLDSLLTFQAGGQAVGLIGKTVEVRTEDNSTVVGEVTTTVFRNGTPELVVQAENGDILTDVSLGQILIVR